MQHLEIPPWWDTAWATWALVIVGTVAACIALRTLDDVKKQTSNTAGSVQAVILSERAWVMAEVEAFAALGGAVVHGDSVSEPSSSQVRFRLKCQNAGKTVAWIDEKLGCFQIVKELPKRPDSSLLEMLDAEPEWVASMSESKRPIDKRLEAKGREGLGDISVVWGVIKYRDVFGPHTTTFGFLLNQNNVFECLPGYPKYNEIT